MATLLTKHFNGRLMSHYYAHFWVLITNARIDYRARVFIIRYCINSQNFFFFFFWGGGGGSWRVWGGGGGGVWGGGGEASPLHPPVDQTLHSTSYIVLPMVLPHREALRPVQFTCQQVNQRLPSADKDPYLKSALMHMQICIYTPTSWPDHQKFVC